MPTFRLTREVRYTHPCTGKHDYRLRDGHYIEADTEAEARAEMCEDYPNDSGWFTCAVMSEEGDPIQSSIEGLSRSKLEFFMYRSICYLYRDEGDGPWDGAIEFNGGEVCQGVNGLIPGDIIDWLDKQVPHPDEVG